MTTPPYLSIGSTVRIISTARKIKRDEVAPAKEILESWGLKVEFGDHLFSQQDQFAGSDIQRAEDLQKALDESQVEAIIFARGGYGTTRIIDKINFEHFQNNPKWLVGYSDITVLHNHVNSNLNIESIHASMPINYPKNTSDALKSIRAALFGERSEFRVVPQSDYRKGKAVGNLVGGNLSIIYSLRGTPYDIDFENKILFIEDLDEYLYHVDRMIQNLRISGKLENLAGLIVGGMTDMRDNETPYGKKAPQIIWEAVSNFSYPVIFDFPAGHLNDNRAIILGRKAELQVTENEAILSF